MTQPLRVFLADDHAIVRQGLAALINAQPDMTVVGEAGDGRSALDKARDCEADIVVMDISMPEMNGVQTTHALKTACPDIKVVALSVHEETSYLRQLLDAGASGYVLKRAAAEELIHALRVIGNGQVYICPAMSAKVMSSFARKQPLRGELAGSELSERETDVVKRIAQGFSNKEIAAHLSLSLKTVETYKARALEKLGLASRADLVRYAVEQGWLEKN